MGEKTKIGEGKEGKLAFWGIPTCTFIQPNEKFKAKIDALNGQEKDTSEPGYLFAEEAKNLKDNY